MKQRAALAAAVATAAIATGALAPGAQAGQNRCPPGDHNPPYCEHHHHHRHHHHHHHRPAGDRAAFDVRRE